MISVTSARGNKETFARLEGLGDLTRKAIRQTWFRAGKDLKAEANREILRRPKSGRTYVIRSRAGRRRRHVASAPGETHANLSGKLRRALSWKVRGTDRMDFGYGVSTTAQNDPPIYSQIEFGFGRVKARPTLKNAIDATQRNIERHFVEEMDRRLKR